MQVFVSWSGSRSRAVAEVLCTWLPNVLQSVQPWMSPNMDKGARWFEEIGTHLENAKAGIVCLTPENADSPWVLFEAGALAKTRADRPCTLLLAMRHGDVKPPLSLFQLTEAASSEEVQKLVETLNAKLGQAALPRERLVATFDKWWPDLHRQLEKIATEQVSMPVPAKRSDRELLEELLELVRAQHREDVPLSSEGMLAALAEGYAGSKTVSFGDWLAGKTLNSARGFFDHVGTRPSAGAGTGAAGTTGLFGPLPANLNRSSVLDDPIASPTGITKPGSSGGSGSGV